MPAASDELIAATVELLRDTPRLHVHLHEVREEVTRLAHAPAASARSSTRPGPGCWTRQVVAAHCVWLDDTDVDLLRDHRVAVAHNPVSNMILASGVARCRGCSREGVTVGLGVDGPASNDSQDMLQTMKVAALLQKVHHLQATR